MITYTEILDIIMLESGQYISDLDATLLNKAKLEILIKRELAYYSRYKPNKVTTEGTLFNGKVFSEEVDGFIPTAIIDIRTDRYIPGGLTTSPLPAPVHAYYWRYTKPKLSMRYPEGVYSWSYIVPHLYKDDKIDSIESHDKFINLLLGKFLMTVGKSRRAFTVDEIPINTDANEMISEGQTLYDKTDEELKTNSFFELSILV